MPSLWLGTLRKAPPFAVCFHCRPWLRHCLRLVCVCSLTPPLALRYPQCKKPAPIFVCTNVSAGANTSYACAEVREERNQRDDTAAILPLHAITFASGANTSCACAEAAPGTAGAGAKAVCDARCGHPHGITTHGLSSQQHGRHHLGLQHNVLPAHQMALITSGCVRARQQLQATAAGLRLQPPEHDLLRRPAR